MNKKEMEIKIIELEFKLKALQNFVFEHHHKFINIFTDNWGNTTEISKALVWVDYPEGRKEEGKHE